MRNRTVPPSFVAPELLAGACRVPAIMAGTSAKPVKPAAVAPAPPAPEKAPATDHPLFGRAFCVALNEAAKKAKTAKRTVWVWLSMNGKFCVGQAAPPSGVWNHHGDFIACIKPGQSVELNPARPGKK